MGCYKNIIDSLRLCGNGDDPVDECGQVNCVCHYGDRDPMCRQKIMYDAADAIEELLRKMGAKDSAIEFGLKRIENLQAENEQLKDQVPQWISVEERLPEPRKKVLACACDDRHDYYKEVSFLLPNGSWLGGFEPTHWMPLPKPPKGVE